MPRKVAYSGKQKKEYLKERRLRKKAAAERDHSLSPGRRARGERPAAAAGAEGGTSETPDPRRALISEFDKLTPQQVKANRLSTMETLYRLPPVIDIPVRPPWNPSDSKARLDAAEATYLEKWIQSVFEAYDPSQLSFFEKNLEVWRQLWRVAEISDVILVVADIRHPLLHFPPSLYRYITQQLSKRMVLVLNKVDLVAPSTVAAWKAYLQAQFPELAITTFACFQDDSHALTQDTRVNDLRSRVKRPRHRRYAAVGADALMATLRDLQISAPAGANVDWDALVARFRNAPVEIEMKHKPAGRGRHAARARSTSRAPRDADVQDSVDVDRHEDYITLGLIGHPNVGKSTLINTLMQRKVVSASKTPGHTKHFQTIYLADNVRLCDCPGLVFPGIIPKPVQILMGLYNIAQVQEPYTSVQFLSERLPIERVLRLQAPDEILAPKQKFWTTYAICEAYAIQRGFRTAKARRPDAYRAANHLLRLVTDGRILLSFKPPGYFDRAHEKTEPHPVPLVYVPEKAKPETESSDEASEADSSEWEGSAVEDEEEDTGIDEDEDGEGSSVEADEAATAEEHDDQEGEDSDDDDVRGSSATKAKTTVNAFAALDMADI
ncbi:hypothetical protein IWQ60_001875 [Tieghemiomyces parasiticus]|uniref:Guanine nucleotide-binding protein-like 1 n=1 Tax=Tieghemiomyces parasiticus TaxID=78921 RepID=A0A9W8E1H5_9FUNG|nr:hypothetical protein IWQ60_001875 [Tieghemiomyces parasiticus]